MDNKDDLYMRFLQDYYMKFGTINDIKPTLVVEYMGKQLRIGEFLKNMRSRYNNYITGNTKSKYSNIKMLGRYKLLEEMDFEWDFFSTKRLYDVLESEFLENDLDRIYELIASNPPANVHYQKKKDVDFYNQNKQYNKSDSADFIYIDKLVGIKFNSPEIRNIVLLDSIVEIPKCTFLSCINLVNIVFSKTLVSIEDSAFCGCKGIQSIHLPESLVKVGNAVFMNCSSLRDFVFPKNLENIPISFFNGCTSLKDVQLSQNLRKIDKRAFEKCKEINFDSLPNTLQIIDDFAFNKCSSFNMEVFPTNLLEIGEHAFDGCQFEKVILPKSLKKLGEGAFDNCLNLDYVSYYGIPVVSLNDNKKYIYFNNESRFVSKLLSQINTDKVKIDFAKIDSDDISVECSYIFTKSLKNLNRIKSSAITFEKLIKNFDYNIFKENVLKMKELGFNSDEVVEAIISGNYGVVSCPLSTAFSNYDYLANQKIIDKKLLDDLYFSDINNLDVAQRFIAYCQKYKAFPDLFCTLLVESTDSNLLELRDRLEYVKNLKLLTDNFDKKYYDKAISMLKRNLFDNLISEDKKAISLIDEEVYSLIEKKYEEMYGMIFPFYNKLSGINDTWFLELVREISRNSEDSTFNKFYQSLTTIKNWKKFSNEIERATRLKNEIVARLLYADIVLTMNGEKVKDKYFYSRYIEKKREQRENNCCIPVSELLKFASCSRDELFRKPVAVRTMLFIDPYSFDALRKSVSLDESLDSRDLQFKYAGNAKSSGYLFSKEEINFYESKGTYSEFKNGNSIDNFIEAINNSICIAKIPKEDKQKYLENVRNLAHSYVKEQNSEDLFSFCRSLDLYLRNNNEYLIQGEESEVVAKKVFDVDSGFNNDARIIYSLYNLNRIAHDALELNCRTALKNKFRLAIDETISYEKMEKVFGSYNKLYLYGLDYNVVDLILDGNRGIYSLMISNEDDRVSAVNDDALVWMFNSLKKNDITDKVISLDDISAIRENLKVISTLTEEEKEIISTSVKEQSVFFECKRLFSEEIMKKLAGDFSADVKNIMNASIDEKREFYAKNGFIAEIQVDDRGNEVLVCLCEAFNEPFSVHLKDLPSSVREQFHASSCSPTIAHCSLNGKGLTLRGENFQSDVEKIDPSNNFVGFRGNSKNLNNVIRSNYDNYDVFAKSFRSVSSDNLELNSMLMDSPVSIKSENIAHNI